jgi:hypothetical protein
MTRDQIARELDISYEQSVAGQIYYMFDFSKQIGKYEYDQDFPLFCGWDFGVGNPTAVLWIQEAPIPGQPFPEIRIIDELEENEKTPPFYADVTKTKPYNLKDDKGNLKPKDIIHFGDPAGKQRQVNMKSWISWLGELGIHIKVKHGTTISECITAGQRIMPFVRVSEKCVRFQECISNYKHPTDDQGRVISDGYEENWATHIMKAFEYYAVNRFPMIKSEVRAL